MFYFLLAVNLCLMAYLFYRSVLCSIVDCFVLMAETAKLRRRAHPIQFRPHPHEVQEWEGCE